MPLPRSTQPKSPRSLSTSLEVSQKIQEGSENGQRGDGHPPAPASPSGPALIRPPGIIPGDSPGTKNGLC